MKKTFVLLFLALAFHLACSGDDGDGPGPLDAASRTDSLLADAPSTSVDGAPEPDASLPYKTKPTLVKGSTKSPTSCTDVCKEKSFPCSTSCEEKGGGYASYGYYDWNYGITKIVKTIAITDCNQAVAKSIEYEGKTNKLAYWKCCCEMPEVKTVAGDVGNLKACADVCKAKGKTGCTGHHIWTSGDVGGVKMRYIRASTGSTAYIYSSCAHVPKTQVSYANALRQLASYSCACY